MKKLFVFVLFILSISPLLAMVGTNVPIKADELVPSTDVITVTPALSESEIKQYDTALYTYELLRQGGYIDFTQVDDDYTFVDFGNDFVDNVLSLIDGTKRYTTRYKQDDSTVFNLTSLGLTPFVDVIRNNLMALPQSDTPAPSPDSDYLDYLAIINGSGFYWKNYSSTSDLGGGYVQTSARYPFGEYSWCCWSNSDSLNIDSNRVLDYDGNALVWCLMPVTINIVGADDTYLLQGSCTVYKYPCYNSWNGYYWNGYYFFRSPNGRDWDGRGGNVWDTVTYSYSGTLTQCFTFIANRFRNVNINVNGVPWSAPFVDNHYVSIGNGTYIQDTNTPVEYQYPNIEVYVDCEDLIEKINEIITNKEVLTYEDIKPLIVDVNGQEAVAVVTIMDKDNIDDFLVKNYGTLIPIFPITASFPVSIDTVASLVVIPASVIPSDILEVLRYIFFGTLLVCLLQRLLE